MNKIMNKMKEEMKKKKEGIGLLGYVLVAVVMIVIILFASKYDYSTTWGKAITAIDNLIDKVTATWK